MELKESGFIMPKRQKFILEVLLITAILFAFLFLVKGGEPAEIIEGYTVEEYVNAIYWAEGGAKTNFPFGIKSIKCEGYDECRRICENTVRNNYRRFQAAWSTSSAKNASSNYLEFLQSRYCPTDGDSLTSAEKRLNHHWIKNVQWFLDHPKRSQ